MTEKKERPFTEAEKQTIAKYNSAMKYLATHYKPEQLQRITISYKEGCAV